MRQLFILCVALALAGCFLDLPLSDPSGSKIDERLLGNWARLELKGGMTYEQMFIGRHATKGNPTGLMDATFVAYNLKNQQLVSGSLGDSGEKTCFSVTDIGDETFVNFYKTGQFGDKSADLSYEGSYDSWVKDKDKHCGILMYRISQDKLTITILDEDNLKSLQENGAVKNLGGKKTLFSSSSFVAYIKEYGTDKLFPPTGSIEFVKKNIIR